MTLADRSVRRQFTAAMALAMALALLVANVAPAQTSMNEVEAVAIDDSCNEVPEDGFTDVPETDTFDDEIECLKAYGFTQGSGDGTTFEPAGHTRRWQMVQFIARLAQEADEQLDEFELPPASDQGFTDIDELEQAFQDNINIMAEIGVVEGTTATTFKPFAFVKRDQMSSFINRLQGAIQDALGGDPDGFVGTEDFFPDVPDTNVHKDNINGLAEAGIVQGKVDGDFDPSEPVTRGQMSAFIMRHYEVNVDDAVLESQFPAGGGDNQTLTVTPDSPTTIEIANPDDSTDDRLYTASDLDDGEEYRITLVDASNVTFDGEEVSFAEDGTTGLVDAGTVAADITVVNGAATPTPANQQTVGSIEPSDGEVTFTVDGALTAESVFPVVYIDGGSNTRLEIDDDGLPTEDFGVGGEATFVPEEAAAGAIGADDSDVTFVNSGEDHFVADDGTEELYTYDSNDLFYVDDGADSAEAVAGDQVSMAEFEAELSVGDALDDATTYAATPEFESTFVLDDITPDAPEVDNVTAAGGVDELDDVTGDTATFEVSNLDEGVDTITVYYDEDSSGDDNTLIAFDEDDFASETFPVDDDDDTEVELTGLDNSTSYDTYLTQTVDGDESAVSTGVELTTAATTDTGDPTITNAEVDDSGSPGVLDDTDTIVLDFSEDMGDALGSAASTFFRVSDGTNIAQVDCGGTIADCSLSDEGGSDDIDDRLVVVLDADPTLMGDSDEVDLAGDPTVTLVSAAFDDQAGNQLDLAGSDDVALDDEDVADIGPSLATATTTLEAGADGGANFDDVGDRLTVTFTQEVDTAAVALTEAQFEALTGVLVTSAGAPTFTVGDDDGDDTLTFTIAVAALTSATTEAGDELPGGDSATVFAEGSLLGADPAEDPIVIADGV
jgi:hypothetical protein